MAVTTTSRLGVTRWSAGGDAFTRAQMDASHSALEAKAAIYLHGTAASRPAANVGGRFYLATDTLTLSYDDGSNWRDVGMIASPTFTGTVTIPTLDLTTAVTASAASHYFIETGSDGVVRPKTLANVKTEVVTTAAVNSAAATTVGTVTSGTWASTLIAGQYGGTGVANTGKTITVSGNTSIGSSTNTVTIATAGNTSVTLPTSGTLVNTAVTALDSLVGIDTTNTGSHTLNIASGVTTSGQTVAINFGTGGASGSLTNITLGGSSGTNTITLNGTTSLAYTADTATAATHYFVETGTDGNIRPKTLANVKTEIVTTAAVNSAAATTVGTVTNGIWNATIIAANKGGTGVANSSNITVGGALTTAAAFTTSGANSLTLTTTGTTDVTLPTSGTLVNSAVTTLSSLASVGTITTGIWNAGAVSATGGTKAAGYFYGGTTAPSNTTRTNYDGYLYATGFYGPLTGNASTASAWSTARTLTIGSTGKTLDGSGNVSWTIGEIGAAPAAGSSNIVTIGDVTSGTINKVTITAPATAATLTLANNSTLSTSGTVTIGSNTNTVTFGTTGNTSVTLPTSGTLVNTAVTTLSSLASVGTITTGTWNAGAITSSGTVSATGLAGSLLSSASPLMNGSVAVGTSAIPSRQDHRHPSDTSRLALAGGTMSGAIAMGSNKITGLASGSSSGDAATYGQLSSVSAVASAALPKSGGTMTGKIILDGDPTSSLHPATKAYVDDGELQLDTTPPASVAAGTWTTIATLTVSTAGVYVVSGWVQVDTSGMFNDDTFVGKILHGSTQVASANVVQRKAGFLDVNVSLSAVVSAAASNTLTLQIFNGGASTYTVNEGRFAAARITRST